MIELISSSWPILTLLIILSVIALSLIIERALYFSSINLKKDNICDIALTLFQQGQLNKAREALNQLKNPSAHLLYQGFELLQKKNEDISLKLSALSSASIRDMEKNVASLATIANISTLIGLFGTVTGMIMAFLDLNQKGLGDPSVLAGGISQALVTTAVGLGIAIPSLLSYGLFTQIINRHIRKMEVYLSELLVLEKKDSKKKPLMEIITEND